MARGFFAGGGRPPRFPIGVSFLRSIAIHKPAVLSKNFAENNWRVCTGEVVAQGV